MEKPTENLNTNTQTDNIMNIQVDPTIVSMQKTNQGNKPSSRHSSISMNSSLIPNDDQDKKIKTLADNIIAAMPHKIKTNSYSSLNSNTNLQSFTGIDLNAEQSSKYVFIGFFSLHFY